MAAGPAALFAAGTLLCAAVGLVRPAAGALVQGAGGPSVVVGLDDDNVNNPLIQPIPPPPDQSFGNGDAIVGSGANDVLIGLLGSDIMLGLGGNDILIGGPEQGSTPNSDVMFGGPGNDVSIWAPGDGSDAFIGGPGTDAQIFGVIDRDADNVPTLTGPVPGFPNGVPTANVSGQGGFCRLERVDDPTFGYEFLVRFFVRATGNLAVTVRLADVEQLFCTSEAGGQIVFADLTSPDPQFEVVSLEDVRRLNRIVAHVIR